MNGNLELTKELLSKGYSFDRPEEIRELMRPDEKEEDHEEL